jgi:integrase
MRIPDHALVSQWGESRQYCRRRPYRFAEGLLRSTTTVNKKLAALRKFCRKLVEWGYLPFNPTSKIVDLPDDSEPRVRYLSVQEYRLLLQEAEEMKMLPHFALGLHFRFLTEYVMLGCNTGLRPSELLHLEGRDIDISGRKLRVRRKPELGFHPKSYHEREVPLNDHAFTAAAALLEQRVGKSDFLFHHRDGSQARSIRESFDTLVKRARLDRSLVSRICCLRKAVASTTTDTHRGTGRMSPDRVGALPRPRIDKKLEDSVTIQPLDNFCLLSRICG